MPPNESYIQNAAQFDVEKKIDEKTAIWKEKTCSFEIQMSLKNDKDKMNKVH
jgi:hypothetical protein